jgi:bifunctional UDP-N-acetylglucosamine pyrophosphorylase/glucosamine-1-phosphate N-acetyltransferase
MLAAGEGRRMHPLTLTKPKPMIKIANRTILDFNLKQLEGLTDELILIIGYKGEVIREFLEKRKYGFRIKFIEQEKQLGTGDALLRAKGLVKGRFLVIMGDNLYRKTDIEKCVEKGISILVQGVERPEDFGVCLSENGLLKGIVEKPRKPESNLANTGLYVLDDTIFRFLEKGGMSERGELELTDAVNQFCSQNEMHIVRAKEWMPVGYVWDVLAVNKRLLEGLEQQIDGVVEKGAVIKDPAVIGKGTIIKSGAYIEGPVVIGKNCKIGPNCYIRPFTSIGDGCRIGNAVEIKNSVIGDNTNICHLSYFGDSIIGDCVNIAAGTISANLRNDGQNVKTLANGMLLDTGRKKFGTVMGDLVKTGINTSIYPGRKIWPHKTTLPGEVVGKDIV